MTGLCVLSDGTNIKGESFGAEVSTNGEMVFQTGMVGYPESLTDPSYYGQILILTYPLIGNYGVPNSKYFESDGIKIKGLIVSDYIDTPSHYDSIKTLDAWMREEGVPGLIIKDTRFLTQKIRNEGSMLGKIVIDEDIDFVDPNKLNLVSKVSNENIIIYKSENYKKNKTIIYLDCGGKNNIIKSFLSRNINLISIPYNFDPTLSDNKKAIDEILKENNLINKISGYFISNGPGNPEMAIETINIVDHMMTQNLPILGICLGNQLIALASGGATKKLKFGHRSQNQPCKLVGTDKCYITTQNHGYEVSKIPDGFRPWFINANDNSNEGLHHNKKPIFSVQFHPEASPGPTDTTWIFDYFIEKL